MGHQQDSTGVIDVLYRAAAEPTEWPAAITSLADHLGALGGMLVRNAADGAEHSSCVAGRLAPDVTERYVREYTDNPWTRAAAPVPIGEVAVLSELYDLREGRHLAWYADVLQPTRTDDMAYLSLPGFTSASSVGGLAFCFSDRGSARVREAAHLMRDLRPHMTRAVWLSQQVDHSRRLGRRLDDMLDSLPQPVLVLSASQRVVGLNPAAEEFLCGSYGFTITAGGRLRGSAADDDALQSAIRAVTSPTRPPDAPMLVHANGRHASLRLLLTPLPGGYELPDLDPEAEATALITVVGIPGSHDANVAALVSIYGLTPTEARVAGLLATGMGREKAAEQAHVSVETIKKHAATCFRKIGVNTQAALAHVVSTLPKT